MRYRAVLFDLFGTLVDLFSREDYRAALADSAAAVGAPPEAFIRLWRRDTARKRVTGGYPTVEANIADICRRLDLHANPDQIAEAARRRIAFTRRTLVPRPEAERTLRLLRGLGLRLGLISNCSPDVVHLWPEVPLAPLLDVAVLSAEVGLKKPDPRIYLLALERLGVAPGAALYVGDGDGGELAGASAVGLRAVCIRAAGEDPHTVARSRPEDWPGERIASLGEVISLLRGAR